MAPPKTDSPLGDAVIAFVPLSFPSAMVKFISVRLTPFATEKIRTVFPPESTTWCPEPSITTELETCNVCASVILPSQAKVTDPPALIAALRLASSQDASAADWPIEGKTD